MSKFISNFNVDQVPGELSVKISFKLPTEQFDEVKIYKRTDMFFYEIYDQSTADILYSQSYSEDVLEDEIEIEDEDVKGDKIYYYSAVTFIDGKAYSNNLSRKAIPVISLFGFEDKFYKLMPEIDRVLDEENELKKFIKVIAKMFEYQYSKTKSLEFFLNIDTAPTEFLRFMSEQIGWELDKELPIHIQRILAKNATFFYKWAGTKLGIESIARVFGAKGAEIVEDLNHFDIYFDSIISSSSRPADIDVEIIKKYVKKLCPIFATFTISFLETLNEDYKEWFRKYNNTEFKNSDKLSKVLLTFAEETFGNNLKDELKCELQTKSNEQLDFQNLELSFEFNASEMNDQELLGYVTITTKYNLGVINFEYCSEVEEKLRSEIKFPVLRESFYKTIGFFRINESKLNEAKMFAIRIKEKMLNEIQMQKFNEKIDPGIFRDRGRGEMLEYIDGEWQVVETRIF